MALELTSTFAIPEFSFPLRPDFVPSNTHKSQSAVNSHSRQYTGIEIPALPITPSANSVSQLKASNPHRKHAHRRSAAISHDFTSLGQPLDAPSTPSMTSMDMFFDLHPPLNQNSPYSAQSPALTFASLSSSSLPMRSSSSLSSTEIQEAVPQIEKRKSWTALFRKKKQPIVLEPEFRTSEDSGEHVFSSSYVSTAELSSAPLIQLVIPEPEPLIDLDAALNPFKANHRRTESAPEPRRSKRGLSTALDETIEEEEDTVIMEQPAATISTTSLASSASTTSNRDRARLARNFNSLTLGPLLDAKEPVPRIPDDPAVAHIKAIHRLSSTTNETITPSVSHRPNSGIFDSPATVRPTEPSDVESVCSDLAEPCAPPAKSRFMRNPAARFSVSSIATFATTESTRRARVWSWMRGRRTR